MASYKAFVVLLILQVYVKFTVQDIFMSNPRGSNNRLNEETVGRANNNRLFNSQNNNNGGYNVGDRGNAPATNENEQYQMRYFQSGTRGDSQLIIEWTHQHGCGGNADTNCNVVLQYLCDDSKNPEDRLRDGLTTASQKYTAMGDDTKQAHDARKKADVSQNSGLHETWQYYDNCRNRQRNMNLFTADQNVKKNEKDVSSASFTRQNNNGARSGYECQEERDYYPYFHPNPWKDIAIITSDVSLCEKVYNENSFNVKPLHECVEFYANGEQKHWSKWNNQVDCETNNGKWTEFYNYLEKASEFKVQALCEAQNNKTVRNLKYKWAVPYGSANINNKECLVLLNAPECKQAAQTRHNHLGNTRDGFATNYVWTLPYFPSKSVQKCIVRARYNISTEDYDGFNTDLKSNQNRRTQSPIRTNPLIKVGEIGSNNTINIRMAINTAQFGRTFQDRSHSFFLIPRGADIPDNAKLINLNVRGKRGNIVQAFPAVEYDFIPNDLTIRQDNLVHVQWTGSNSNPKNSAGQGQAGTDRSNLVQIRTLNVNYPVPFENALKDFWGNAEAVGLLDDGLIVSGAKKTSFLRKSTSQANDLALYFATAGYYQCYEAAKCGDSSAQTKSAKLQLDVDLNIAPASFPGAVLKFKQANKTYFYMSSRNNAYSNRSQKGVIKVVA